MKGILADKYNNENFKEILQSGYTEIQNTENLLELTLTPKDELMCKEIFLFTDFLEKEENRSVKLNIKYDEEKANKIVSEWDEIVYYTTRNKPLMQAMLKDSNIEIKDSDATIFLPIKGANFLCENRYDLELKNTLQQLYSFKYNLKIKDEIDQEYCNTLISNIKEAEEKLANDIINNITQNLNNNFNNENNNQKKDNNNLNKRNNNNNNNFKKNNFDFKNKTIDFSIPNLIIGVNRKSDLPLSKIIELNEDSGVVKVEGQIVSYDVREIRNEKAIITINIYDGTYSIYSKSFVSKEDIKEIVKRLKASKKLRVFGKTEIDNYSNELIIKGYTIFDIVEDELNKINKDEKKNQEKTENKNSNKIERVELTAHTTMSMLEGLISPKQLISTVKKNNMKAVGITDSSVVQAYPSIMYETMNTDIKAIYGLKAVIAEDSKSVLSFSQNQKVQESTYCILDIETTGLSFRTDKITEIAVLKYKNGKIIDTYESFVNPEVDIPEHITKLTGITNEMVKDAPKKEQVIKEFLDFVGNDSILVAHNADFDIGFIKYIVEKMNLEMNNTYLDTLILAKILYPELSRFNLGALAKHLKIKVDVAHRALDDVKTLTYVLIDMLKLLKEENVVNWDDIDKKIDSSDDAFKRALTYDGTILSKNLEGLKQIYTLVSDSHVNHYYFRPRILKSILTMNRSGVLIGSGNSGSELYTAILSGKTDEELEEIIEYYDFIEVQPVSNHNYLLKTKKVESEEDLRGINKKIIKLAEKLNKIVVATGDVYILKSEDTIYKEILDVSRKKRNPEIQADTHFRTTDEMLKEFEYLGKEKAYEIVVKNTNIIADMCEPISPISKIKATPQIENGDEILRELCYTKAKELYGEDIPENIKARLDKELNSIIENGYSALYLLAEKLVRKSNEDGYIVGSRGSVGSSIAAYMANITEVNSLEPHYRCPKCKYSEFTNEAPTGIDLKDKDCPKCGTKLFKDGVDIPFETFLGFKGNKEPDIDLNFSSEYQNYIHQFVDTIIGNGKTYKAGTIGSIQSKTAFGYVIAYYENLGKELPSKAEIERLSKNLVGVKRTTGQHPGGIIVVPEGYDILEFTPIQKPADKVDSQVVTTHFDYHTIESNLLKLDLLGHEDPTTVRVLQDITGVNPVEIPLDDPDTMSLFSSTKAIGVTEEQILNKIGTLGIPEFGTLFVRGMLEETRPTTFDELIKISGLSHGTDVWLNNAQNLVKDGTITLKEAICTRDDIMIYLISKGIESSHAFTIMEKVRKGKGLAEEDETVMRENDVPEWYIKSCKTIKYMFPKAHAAAYVTLAYRIAWFKVHYPEAFYTAYFSTMLEVFDSTYMLDGKIKIKEKLVEARKNFKKSKTDERLFYLLESLNEFYERGFSFEKISLYDSDSIRFKLNENKKIIPPFASIPGLGGIAANSIIKAREDGEFKTKEDLKERAKIGDSIIELLDKLEIISDLPDSMQMSLFEI